jgi:glycosyltransferase involved in cell wall biosynthesis
MLRTLTLVRLGQGKPSPEILEQFQNEGRMPRITLYEKSLGSDLLDERYLCSLPPHTRRWYRWLSPPASQVLEAFHARHRYDALISWSEQLGFPLAGLLKITASDIPHVGIFSWISKPRKIRALRAIKSHFTRLILMSSVQRDAAVNLAGLRPDQVVLLRWPVDQLFWKPMPMEDDTICAVGREMRDYGTLIAAIRDLRIPCHIAANMSPEKKDAWIRDVEAASPLPPHLTIGKKAYPELRELYARSRFVVIPLLATDTDNGATAILEAMAMGKAVICSRVKGQQDIVRDGVNGIFVAPQDPRALRNAIQSLWDHPDVAHRMGQAGRAWIEKYHTLDSWVGSVRDTVIAAIDEKRRKDG